MNQRSTSKHFSSLLRRHSAFAVVSLLIAVPALRAQDAPKPEPQTWPPVLQVAPTGSVTVTSPDFLKIPASVTAGLAKPGAMQFTMAKTPPVVDLALHHSLPGPSLNGTGWSAWGDIGVAADGKVYVGTGDHGDNNKLPSAGGGNALIYMWDPATKVLTQIADLNKIAGVGEGDPSWSKVHAGVTEGRNGKVYYTGTLNDGGQSFNQKWSKKVPGGQLFEYDPKTGQSKIISTFPGEVTPTTGIDRERNIWYANLEGKTKANDISLAAVDLNNGKLLYQSPRDAVTASRNFAIARDGAVYFNGKDGIWKYNPNTKTIAPTKSAFPPAKSMRSSTGETKAGYIYGTVMSPGAFFRYAPATDKLEMLGPDFLLGDYTTVTVLSPDEKFVYYLPGAHGGAADIGTPVVQYDIATGQRKVLAFLKEGMEKLTGYSPAGTYGVKISPDGATLYVGFNGNMSDAAVRPAKHAKGFGLTSLAAIHIPASER